MSEKSSIFNHVTRALPAHPVFKLGSFIALMLVGGMTAFGIAPNTVIYTGPLSNVVEVIDSPPVSLLESGVDIHVRETQIQRGDTVSSLLSGVGLDDTNAMRFLRTSQDADALFRQLVPGKTLTAKVSSDGSLHLLTFPLNGEKNAALQIRRTPDGFDAHIHGLAFDTQITMQSAVIRHSLFGAADDAGIPDGVAVQLADIFGGDIDFHRDLRQGDQFSVIYETANHMGRSVQIQRILAAEFINNGKKFHAFWYQGKDGKGGYYSADGRSVKKAFLRSPLEFSRVTSGFSNARFHPVLQQVRAHRGIDYGAPTGTRIKATGDGVIDFVGTQGGYGKTVIIRHTGNRTTLYAHMSKFAAGVRKGARISQGDIVGYVGATGTATGPHLHYEFRVAGVHRNPLTVALPGATPLPQSELPKFLAHSDSMLTQITAIRNTQYVMLD